MGLTEATHGVTATDWLNASLSALAALRVSVRPEASNSDIDFSASLYALTRDEEMARVDWPEAQKHAFCRQQFDAQHSHYRQHYPTAELLIIERGAEPAGRLYFEQTAKELRLMEITLLTKLRNGGIGVAIARALLQHAHAAGIPMGLHVEPFNPARRLYERLGFRDIETRGLYIYMVSAPPDAATVAAARATA